MVNTNVSIIKEFIQSIRFVSEDKELKTKFSLTPSCFIRERKLNFSAVSFLILSMLKKSLNIELQNFFDKQNETGLMPCSKSAFCQQRQKISSNWFKFLIEYISRLFYEQDNIVKRWKGYKIISVDGSAAFLVNNKEVQNYYHGGVNQYGGYALARYMKMYDVLNGITLKAELMPFNNSERYMSYKWVDAMHDDAITLFDRGYPAYTLFFLMQNSETPKPFVMRCKKHFTHAVKKFVYTDSTDEIITFYPDDRAIKTLYEYGVRVSHQTPVQIRAVKVLLANGETEVLLTNLFDKRIVSLKNLAELYRMRWLIETDIGKEKNLFQLENFSSHTRNSIEQDFYANFVAANIHQLITMQANESVKRKTRKRKYIYKINTSASLAVFKKKLVQLYYTKKLKDLLLHLQNVFEQFTEPIRPDRSIPRIKKSKRRYGKHQTQTNYRNNL
ncbi:MAG: IS4 family transposase [Ginsengibacter sp.]